MALPLSAFMGKLPQDSSCRTSTQVQHGNHSRRSAGALWRVEKHHEGLHCSDR